MSRESGVVTHTTDDHHASRRSVLTSIATVEERLKDVRSVALGGMMLENRPATLVRALIRSGATGLFLTSAPTAAWDADLLIGAGRVDRVRIPHLSLGSLGLAPSLSTAAADRVEFEMVDEATLIGAYMAASANASLQVLDHLGRNDVIDDNPLIVRRGDLRGVEPLRVDVALLHAPLGDEQGNLVHRGSRYADLLMARAADVVIAQVDEVVSTQQAAELGITIPAAEVDAVVATSCAAHPAGSAGHYTADLAHLAAYKEAVRRGELVDYVDTWVDVDIDTYLSRIDQDHRAGLERQGVA